MIFGRTRAFMGNAAYERNRKVVRNIQGAAR